MLSLNRKLTAYLIVAWFLTGVMLLAPLAVVLSANDNSTICVDERVLESDEERVDFGGLDFEESGLAGEVSSNIARSLLVAIDHVEAFEAVHIAHLQRGPPCR